MSTMKAVRIHKTGGPEVLQVEEIAKPQPGEGQVLIQIHAVGINPYETYMRAGTFHHQQEMPYTPGMDCAGVIEAVGSGVTEFKPGDRVYTLSTLKGAYAEYTVALPKYVFGLPDSLSFVQGASIANPYFTAYKAIHKRAMAKQGETMFVHGASGGVGLAAVQLGKAFGLRVLGTAGTDEGLAVVSSNGADDVFNHKEQGYLEKIKAATDGTGVDFILEMVIEANLSSDIDLLVNRGRVVLVGCKGPAEVNFLPAMIKEISIIGMNLINLLEDELEELGTGVQNAVECGHARPSIYKEYKLSEASHAHRDLEGSKKTHGNLVLNLESDS